MSVIVAVDKGRTTDSLQELEQSLRVVDGGVAARARVEPAPVEVFTDQRTPVAGQTQG